MYDHNTALNILGSLVKKPILLIDDKYNINEQDFAERFHTIVFGAISNLFHSGTQVITPREIDIYLTDYPMQKKIFDDNNGMDYIENITRYAELENFEFHYNSLKKYTLLRNLKEKGISVEEFIDEKIVDPKKNEDMMIRFKDLSINDILNNVETRIISIKDKFYLDKDVQEVHAGDHFDRLVEEYQKQPVMGLPLNSNILNTIYSGARTKALYLNSSPTGGFKSRISMGNCGRVSIPYYFDVIENKWIHTGYCEPTLFITTELDTEEISTMLMAYVSGIDEDKIIKGKCSGEELERLKIANQYVKEANLYFVQIPDFSISQVEQIIKKYNITYGVTYVYFDYIFTSMKMLQEISSQTGRTPMRIDNMLLLFIDKLKQLTSTLDIHISTSTQVSDGWQNSKSPDSSLISACKALSTKADIATVTLPVRKEELELLQPLLSKGLYPTPNICVHVYKVRRGKFNKIRVYLYFDGGTCRTTELFATNDSCEHLEITGTNIQKILEDTETEIADLNIEEIEEEIQEQEQEEKNSQELKHDETDKKEVLW